MTSKPTHDLIIVGGGPAGMTAAIFAARANLKSVLIERHVCGGMVNETYEVRNFPSYISINGLELMEKIKEQVARLGVAVDQAAEIESLELDGEMKTVVTDEFQYHAPALILAPGCDPIRLPRLEGCEQVHYCSICDGPAYAGRRVVVIGGGNSGFDETLYLLSLGIEHVTIIELRDVCTAERSVQETVGQRDNVSVRVQTGIKDIVVEGGRLTAVVLEDACSGRIETVPADGLFVFIGHRPNTGMLKGVLDLSNQGYIRVDPDMKTSLPGVFASGDAVEKRYRQIVTAMSDGAIAALSAAAWIRENA